MPGQGGGQIRKSHKKSRLGCNTCKRRHIRCDETPRQCQNCTKHNVRCAYMDAHSEGTRAGSDPNTERPQLDWPPQAREEVRRWQETGVCPFLDLGINLGSPPAHCSETDLRLIHHIFSIARHMRNAESSESSVWVQGIPAFFQIAWTHRFVMEALLSLSASHLSWVTTSPTTLQLSFKHCQLALQGLRVAMDNFSKENSDAILAASMLLSWQALDWPDWQILMRGTSTVVENMEEWKNESLFAELIREMNHFNRSPEIRCPNLEQDQELLHYVYTSLQKLQRYVVDKEEETKGLSDLIHFVQNVLHNLEMVGPEDQFAVLHPLRNWLCFLPISFVKRVKEDPDVMILLAHFYAVALAVEPLFPAVGAAWFGMVAVGPIYEIHGKLLKIREDVESSQKCHWPLSLIEFPLEMAREFCLRMGWQPRHMGSEDAMAADSSRSSTNPTTPGSVAMSGTHSSSPEAVMDAPDARILRAPSATYSGVFGLRNIEPMGNEAFFGEGFLWRGHQIA